ncbi:MAG: hypothetical protein LIP04_09950 [Tannerellaceae bacterium]|nr:hypothetical protein [Tannerellaceae bacterium]
MKKEIYKTAWLLCLLGLLLGGCTKEELNEETDPIDSDEIEVQFQYAVPDFSVVATRAKTANEMAVSQVTVIAYEVGAQGEETLAYIRPGTISGSLVSNGVSGSFKVRLAKSKSGEKYTFDFLFNLRTTIDNSLASLTPGKTRREVQQALVHTTGVIRTVTAGSMPMWAGITEGMEVRPETSFPTLNLISSVARIDVGLNLDENDVAQGLTNFTFSNLYFYYLPSSGLYIPDVNYVAGNKVIAPSLADPYSTNSSPTNLPVTANAITCYIFEPDVNYVSPNGSFTLIVSGTYTDPDGTTSTQYYPIRLMDPDDPEKKLPILRNHLYQMNIVSINGPGYTSDLLALRGGGDAELTGNATNITYDLHVQENGDINYVVYNKSNFLGVSTVYESRGSGANPIEVKVKTDVSGGWNVGVTDANGNAVSWLTCSPASSSLNTVTSATLTLTANSSGSRTAYVTFTAGSLSITVEIEQA